MLIKKTNLQKSATYWKIMKIYIPPKLISYSSSEPTSVEFFLFFFKLCAN